MSPYGMSRKELEDTVVILQQICNNAARTVNAAMLELKHGIPLRSLDLLNDALHQLTDVPRRPLEASRIDQNHLTYQGEVA
jgi:hypothetical protein